MSGFKLSIYLAWLLSSLLLTACGGGSSSGGGGAPVETETEVETGADLEDAVLDLAFDYFGANVTSYVDGSEIVVEATGFPDHESPYWDPAGSSGLYVAPTVTTTERLVPGFIDNYAGGGYTLRVPGSPEKAASSSATGLGPIGIAVSGAPIYNDEEGAGRAIDEAIGGLDFNGAHTGPSSYHYHLEPKSFTDDDDALVGVIADGFFLFGRKCYSSGTYPDDLDASGGHIGITQYTEGAEEYHYHIQNQAYLDQYYILFPGDYQGIASAIN